MASVEMAGEVTVDRLRETYYDGKRIPAYTDRVLFRCALTPPPGPGSDADTGIGTGPGPSPFPS